MRKFMQRLARTITASTVFLAGSVWADTYPSKPIQLIVPTGAGGIADVAVRILAPRWSEFLGQPIVIQNRSGSGGVIGTNQTAKAEPDGYTLFAGYDSIIVALPFVQKTVDYGIDSFDYLNGFGVSSIYFFARSDSPYTSIKDFIDAAKRQPGKLAVSSYGVGVIAHFAAQRLWDLTSTDVLYVPYKSSPEAASALLAKDVDVAVTAGGGALRNNPNARVLGIAAEQRRDDFPNARTLKEQGYPVSLDFYIALMAPKGLPPDVKAKLTDAIQKANAKYGDQFKVQLQRAGDLSYTNISGDEVYRIWKDRQAWFRETAPRMNLEGK